MRLHCVKKFVLKLWFLLFFSLIGCQSRNNITSGIQPGFEAVNPAAILAVPIFTLPDPSTENSLIDPSLMVTENFLPSLEDKIIQSNFTNQPNINGYSFSAVRKAILSGAPKKVGQNAPTKKGEVDGKKAEVDNKKKNEVKIWDGLNFSMRNVAERFSSRDVKVRLLISPNCLARKNFVEFYTYCLASDLTWLSYLNALSSRVYNADSALITVVTDLQNKVVDEEYQIYGGVAVLLVDTNNGKLIWGNFKKETLINPKEKKYFPSWNEFLNKIFVPEFWNNFPGRIGKNQLLIPQ